MNATRTGLLAGLILVVEGSIGGFGTFLITLVVGIVGMLVGMALVLSTLWPRPPDGAAQSGGGM